MNLDKRQATALKGVLLAAAMSVCGLAMLPRPEPSDYRLVSIQEFPDYGEFCLPPEPISSDVNLFAETTDSGEDDYWLSLLWGGSAYAASQQDGQTVDVNRAPVRRIWDTDPVYSAIAINPRTSKIFLYDLNMWKIQVFDRLENTPVSARRSEPERVIGGEGTGMQFNTCITIDPENGDIYTVENDIGDSVAVFSQDAQGNVAPLRTLDVTHRAHSLAIHPDRNELFVSVQYPPQVEVYRKTASGDEKPLRVLSGETTRLANVNGIALDTKTNELFASNWGAVSFYDVAGSGRFEDPSITVYPLDASGDSAPARVIQGSRTQLNWPGQMFVDSERGEIYIANTVGHSILVFDSKAEGNVAPKRIIKGGRTGLTYPTSLAVDLQNRELWIANLGNASATVYPLQARGDAVPLRTIRSAERNKVSLKFGKTQAVTYDSVREEILVPN